MFISSLVQNIFHFSDIFWKIEMWYELHFDEALCLILYGMIHFIIVQNVQIVRAIYLPIRVTEQGKLEVEFLPNTHQYLLASICKSSGKPSTRFPLGRLVELKTSSGKIFLNFSTFYLFNICFWKVNGTSNSNFERLQAWYSHTIHSYILN